MAPAAGTGMANRHNFFSNLARRFCILPIKMLDYKEARIKVSHYTLTKLPALIHTLQFLNTLRECSMAEAAERLTVSTAALLMLCSKASGLSRQDYSAWKSKCENHFNVLKQRVLN